MAQVMERGSARGGSADNIGRLIWHSGRLEALRLLNILPPRANVGAMTRLTLTLLITLVAGPVSAACFADYKAKRDDPLRLHYGVAEIRGDCARGPAAEELRPRLAAGGWELLNIVSVFGDDGLDEREESAGEFHLRF